MGKVVTDLEKQAREWLEKSIGAHHIDSSTVASLSTLLQAVRDEALEDAARDPCYYISEYHDEVLAEVIAERIRALKSVKP